MCDIIQDRTTDPAIYHWVVESQETNEVVGMGQAKSLQEAEAAAFDLLSNLGIRDAA